MYNKAFKEQFIEELDSDSYRNSYLALFNKSAEYEEEIGKDLYDFNMPEIEGFYFSMATRSLHSLRATNFLMMKYADYAIEKGLRQSNINIFKLITLEQLKKYSATYKNQYLTLEDVNEFMDYIVNDVDVAIFRGLFEGIRGGNFSEFVNLKPEDIVKGEDDKYYVNLTEDLPDGTQSHRTIPISDTLHRDLVRANEQTHYLGSNGMAETQKANEIVDSPYVFRPNKRGAYHKSNGQINMQTIYRKKNMLDDVTDGQIKRVNSLIVSGMVHEAKRLYDIHQELTDDDYISIGEQFNNNKVTEYDSQKAKHIRGVVRNGLKELYNIEV